MPEISLCPGPAHLPGLSTTPESGSNTKNIFEEGDAFDGICPSLPSGKRRRRAHYQLMQQGGSGDLNAPQTVQPHAAHLGFLSERALFGRESDIEKRGVRGAVMVLCNPQGNGRASLYTQNHPGASSILKLTGKAWTVSRRGVCAAIGITGLLTLDPNTNWVTEHVFEKQELRDNIEYMIKGILPDGTKLKAGAVAFQGVFDNNGLFQNSWASPPSLTVALTWVGNIQDTFMGVLGRTADQGLNNQYTANLQVCDADFNRYKEYIVAGLDWMSNSEWKQYSNLDRIGILSDVIDSFAYRAEADVVKAYSSSYTALVTLWGDFAKHAAANGVNYDFVSAWKEVVKANLEYQVKTATSLFEKYLDGEITYWASSAAVKSHAPAVVTQMTTKLGGFKSNLSNLLTLPISKMTA
jgi:chitinase